MHYLDEIGFQTFYYSRFHNLYLLIGPDATTANDLQVNLDLVTGKPLPNRIDPNLHFEPGEENFPTKPNPRRNRQIFHLVAWYHISFATK